MSDRNQLRQMYFTAWEKFQKQQPLAILEQQIVTCIQQHPEYVSVIENPNESLGENYTSDTNPFLHLGLHLSLQEQLNTKRPKGINAIYQKLLQKYQNAHTVQHRMMDVMANLLWQATAPVDDAVYLEKLLEIVEGTGSKKGPNQPVEG